MKKYWLLLIFLLFVFALPSVFALSFSSNPFISPTNVSTTESFACDFTPSGSGSLTANITWYVDGVSWTYNDQSLAVTSGNSYSSSSILPANTSKHQKWRCQVTLDNSTTTNSTNSSEMEIQNTLPNINEPSQLVFYEDTYYNFLMSASDADGDSILLWNSLDLDRGSYNNQELFDILANGTIIINESDESLVGNHTMRILADDEVGSGSQKEFEFQLVAVNDAPIFSLPSLSYQCNETQFCSGVVVATDQDNDSNDLTYQFNTSAIDINASSDGSFSFIPTYDQAVTQNWSIEVNVTDGIITSTSYLNLTILSTNHEPNFSYVDVSGTQNDSLYTFYFNVTDPLDPQDVFFFNIYDNCGKDVWIMENLSNGSSSTNATGLINMSIQSNDFVECRDVTVSVLEYDSSFMIKPKEIYNHSLTLDINNINDAPVIHELSNLNIRKNISDQLAAIYLSYEYAVNATDVDMLTYEDDELFYWLSGVSTFNNGDPMFVMNSSNGIITSVQSEMNESYAGIHEFTVNVNDSLTPILQDSRNITINISYNLPPVINAFNSTSCADNFSCLKNISASDAEFSESFLTLNNLNYTNPLNISRNNYTQDEISSFLGINLTGEFSGTTTSYWINFTPYDKDVGFYELNISFRDDVGNVNTSILYFNITNTPQAPNFDNDNNHSVLEPVSFGIVAETLPFLKHVFFYDSDLFYGLDDLNFSFVFDGPTLPSFNISKINNSCALINYTVDSVSSGSYTINITLNDSYNLSTTQVVNFDVHDTNEFPNITKVTPFFNATSGLTDTSFLNINNESSASVNFAEGNTATFDIRAFDNDNESMNVSWYFNGSLVQHNIYNSSNLGSSSYQKTFSFFDNGTYNVTVRVEDIGFDEFTWIVNVSNFNRPPTLENDMDNMSGNAAIRGSSNVFYSNFFKLYWNAKIVFYDPDDDLNSDGEINGGEVNNLIFSLNTSGGCDELALFDFVPYSDNVTIRPVTTGLCSTSFIAVDPYNRSVNSNEVELEIIKIQSDSGSSSSGSTTIVETETITIPFEEEVLVPESFKLLYPGTTTIYENGSVSIPIVLKNNWEGDLSSITLSVNDSRNNLTYSFSNSFIANLPEGKSLNETLTLVGYRLDGPFEFNVTAEIGSLNHVDSATVYVNSLERGKEDIESLKSRIGYARDLLSDNPVCAELVEILDQAEENMETVSMEKINGVINGCKYLTGEIKAPSNSLPKSFTGRLSVYGKTIIDYNLLFIILGSLIALAIIVSVVAKFALKKI